MKQVLMALHFILKEIGWDGTTSRKLVRYSVFTLCFTCATLKCLSESSVTAAQVEKTFLVSQLHGDIYLNIAYS